MFERLKVKVTHYLRGTRSVINRHWRFEKRLEQAEEQEAQLITKIHQDIDEIDRYARDVTSKAEQNALLHTEEDILKLHKEAERLQGTMQDLVNNSCNLALTRYDAARAILAEFDAVIFRIEKELFKRKEREEQLAKQIGTETHPAIRQDLQNEYNKIFREAGEYKAVIDLLDEECKKAHAVIATLEANLSSSFQRLQHAYDHLETGVSGDLLAENPQALAQIARRDAKREGANLQDMQTFQRTIRTIGKRLQDLAAKNVLDENVMDDIVNTMITFSDGYHQLTKTLQEGADEDYHLLLTHLSAVAKLQKEVKDALAQLQRYDRPETRVKIRELEGRLTAIPTTLATATAVSAKRLRGATSEVTRSGTLQKLHDSWLGKVAAISLLVSMLATTTGNGAQSQNTVITKEKVSANAATIFQYGFAAKTLTQEQVQELYSIIHHEMHTFGERTQGPITMQVSIVGSADESHKPNAHHRNVEIYAQARADEMQRILDSAVYEYRQTLGSEPGKDVNLTTAVTVMEGDSPLSHPEARSNAQYHYLGVKGALHSAEAKAILDEQRYSSIFIHLEGEKATEVVILVPMPLPPTVLPPPIPIPGARRFQDHSFEDVTTTRSTRLPAGNSKGTMSRVETGGYGVGYNDWNINKLPKTWQGFSRRGEVLSVLTEPLRMFMRLKQQDYSKAVDEASKALYIKLSQNIPQWTSRYKVVFPTWLASTKADRAQAFNALAMVFHEADRGKDWNESLALAQNALLFLTTLPEP